VTGEALGLLKSSAHSGRTLLIAVNSDSPSCKHGRRFAQYQGLATECYSV